tara:strand:- start:693 stop:1187 length:495 start_codon:yes stop_codon:yes gene_type:complete
MSRDIDKEKKDQRRAECKALRDARKRGVLKTVMSTSNIKEAAKLERMTPADLTQTLRSYGVKRGAGQYWRHAVKEYMDAGMPHQYELRLHSISDDKEVDWFDDETFEKPWSWIDETELEINTDLETKLEQTLEEAILEGKDLAELIVPDPAHPDRTIKYTLPLR